MEFQIIAGDLCLDFINTLDNRPTPGRLKELLPTYSDLVEWSAQSGAIVPARRNALMKAALENRRTAESARQKAIQLRECLYRLLTASLHRERPVPADMVTFSRYLAEALSKLELNKSRSGFHLDWKSAEGQLDSLLWPVVKAASDLLTSSDLERVRECNSASCRWLFIDRSKNHSRRWCDMAVCGNRVKAQRFYRRQQHAS